LRPNAVSEASTMKPLSGCDFHRRERSIVSPTNVLLCELLWLLTVVCYVRKINALAEFKTEFTEALTPVRESLRHGFTIARFVAIVIH
jgi:hypothetical protein